MSDESQAPVQEKTNGAETPKGAFAEMLYRNNKQIRRDRADTIIEDAEVLYRRKIEDIKLAISRHTRDRENMLDLSPTDARSLKLASDFDAEEFVNKDVDVSVNLRNLRIKYEIAVERYEHLFGKSLN